MPKKIAKRPIPIDRVLDAFSYDAENGVLINKKTSFAYRRCDPRGYVVVPFEGVVYMAHRLIYAIVYGKEPNEIDHINGIKDDNRLENIRSCTRSQNIQSYYDRQRASL